jgi:hypothetical protein
VSDFNDLVREINDFWNSRLASLRYKSCVKVKINVSINPYIAGPEAQPPGHDLDFLPENGHWEQGALKRPLLWLPPGETDPTADSADSYANPQHGRWTGTMVELGIRAFAHEVGHLLGLGDDYIDHEHGAETDKEGRAGTLMDDGSIIDQQIMDRLGALLEKAGIKLPECWTGKMTSHVSRRGGGMVCTARWETQLTFGIDPMGKIAGDAKARRRTAVCSATNAGTITVWDLRVTGSADTKRLRLTLIPTGSHPPALLFGGDVSAVDNTNFCHVACSASTEHQVLAVPRTAPCEAKGDLETQSQAGILANSGRHRLELKCVRQKSS